MNETSRHRNCAVCHHEWTKRKGSEDPKRCPNPECKSVRWQTGIDRRFHIPEVVHRVIRHASHAQCLSGSDLFVCPWHLERNCNRKPLAVSILA